VFYKNIFKGGYSSYNTDSLLLDSLIRIIEDIPVNDRITGNIDQIQEDTIFSFNPNDITFHQMILLGFDSIIARRIIKYRNSGGKFKVKKDLLRIYDLPEILYAKLKDHISLPDTTEISKFKNQSDLISTMNTISEQKVKMAIFNINDADTFDLMTIPGIGSVLSKRIIKYRDLLGGYSNINQLNDVYGLKGYSLANVKSAVYVDTAFIPERIRINFSEWKEFVQHPYINGRLAKDIVHLRSTKGFIEGIHDLKDIPYLNDSILNCLNPYFEF
jgi:DNA uptake protein ComE-like DNA-binding protein